MLPDSTRPTFANTSRPTAGYRYLVPPWPLDVPPRLQLLHTDIRSWVGEDAAAVPLRCGAAAPPGGWLLERVPCMLVRFRCTGTAMLLYSQPFPASPPSCSVSEIQSCTALYLGWVRSDLYRYMYIHRLVPVHPHVCRCKLSLISHSFGGAHPHILYARMGPL